MRSRLLMIAAMSAVGACGAGAQAAATKPSGIELVASHQVSVDNATHPHAESFIAVDPKDTKHLLTIANAIVGGNTVAYPYASFDGGKTWTRGRVVGDTTIVTGGDPIVHINRTGSAFFVSLARLRGRGVSLVSRSIDGGRTWSSGVVLPSADREWMAFDTSRAPFSGRTYFSGTGSYWSRSGDPQRTASPYLAWSDDDGQSFPLTNIVAHDIGGPDPQAALIGVPMEPQVTRNGVLVLPINAPAHLFATDDEYRRDTLPQRRVGLLASDDGGQSFGAVKYSPIFLTTMGGNPARQFRALSAFGVARTAIDATVGSYRDRFYFVASDYDTLANRYVVRVWRTSDLGKTWSAVVASDAPRGDAGNPAIAVNRDGVVAVTWNDRRDDPKTRCWQLYAAISTDGAEHFLPSQRLSTKQTCTNEPNNWETFGMGFNSTQSGQYLAHLQSSALIPIRWPNGGDTQGLAADATGMFHAAWINGETGVMQLWHTTFQVTPTLVAELRAKTVPSGGDYGRVNDSTVVNVPVPAGMEEVTPEIKFEVSKTQLDFATHSYTITAAIKNEGGRVLRAPLRAVMAQFLTARERGLGLKNLQPANADNGGRGTGAVWDFQAPDSTLRPGATTTPRVIRFTFEGGIPEVPDGGYLDPGFKVFARADSNKNSAVDTRPK